MKKSILFLLICFISITVLPAQIKLGVKVGGSTTSLNASQINLFNQGGLKELQLALADANYGIHGGFLVQVKLGGLLIQPEFLFNSNSVDYEVTDLSTLISQIKTEKYQYLDIPVLLGFKLGPLRLMAGPEAHVYLNNTSGLLDFDGYRQDFDELTLAWMGGVGLDLWNIMLDLRYEGNLTNFGSHINFKGNSYSFDERPSRWLFSVSFLLGK